jgi:uncharacterized protein YjbJ (UPF0337 family)
MAEKAKGRMKEAAGAFTGDEDKKAEGRAQQRKSDAREEATQKERTRREQDEAKQAERERDRQSRKGKGPLSGLQRLAWGLIGMRDFRHETVLEGSET